MPFQRFTLPPKGAPAELVRDAAARLARGQVLVLPTETVYGLSADPRSADAVRRLCEIKGIENARPFTLHVADPGDAAARVGTLPRPATRLVERFWPGPLSVVVRCPDGGTIGIRLPAHEFTRAVIRTAGHGLWMTSVNRTGEPPLIDPDAIAAAFGDTVDALFDSGRPPLAQASTIVRCTGPELEILREGTLSAAETLRAAAARVLFVCTGNTCRSPLAEAIARSLVAEAWSVPTERVLARGLDFLSAGVSTLAGMPASAAALAAGAEIGLDLASHRTTALSRADLARADAIYCLAESHRAATLALLPSAAPRCHLLAADGSGIPDPFGSGLEEYRGARDRIAAALKARLPELLALVG